MTSDVEILTPSGEPLADLPITLPAGASSLPVDLDVWYLRTSTDPGPPLDEVAVGLAVEADGVGTLRGHPPLDELWTRAQELDPSTVQPLGDPVPVGAHRRLVLAGPVPVGGRRRVRLVWRPPSFAAAGAWRFVVVVWAQEHARALAVPHLGGPGVVAGVGDRQRSGLVRGGLRGDIVTPSDPPDDRVHVGRRQILDRGALVGRPSEIHVLDRIDGDGQALADLERYRATVVWQTGAWRPGEASTILHKGPRAAPGVEPEAPALSVGDRVLGQVVVEAPVGGGPPVVDPAAFDGDGPLYDRPLYDRHLAEPHPTDPATLVVHAGDALGGGTHRWWSTRAAVALPTDAAWSLWQTPAGLWSVTEDDAAGAPVPPASHPETSLGPFWRGTTDAAGVVTSLVDRRTWSEPVAVLTLAAEIGAVGDVWAELPIEHPRLHVDRVVLRASDLGGATGGRLLVDVEVDGATLYPSAAAELAAGVADPRPQLAHDADPLRDAASIPDVGTLHAGQVVTVRGVELPTGGAPTRCTLSLVCFVR